ncbi:hypothetical protein OF83DRAFT_1179979 [Amylostereum chailletii]|nr:hypothetical protein OF83DRAFT_1179979 [Amylostereum chailletii]
MQRVGNPPRQPLFRPNADPPSVPPSTHAPTLPPSTRAPTPRVPSISGSVAGSSVRAPSVRSATVHANVLVMSQVEADFSGPTSDASASDSDSDTEALHTRKPCLYRDNVLSVPRVPDPASDLRHCDGQDCGT